MWTTFLCGLVLAHFEYPAKSPSKSLAKCPKCGTSLSGKPSCCGRTGAWYDKCGLPGDSDFDHTWNEGIRACQSRAPLPKTTIATTTPSPRTTKATTTRSASKWDSTTCLKCGIKKSGRRSCCFPGGTWFKNCGNDGDSRVDHTWTQGIRVCKSMPTEAPTEETSASAIGGDECPKCGTLRSGKLSCCAEGAAWFNKCGDIGNKKFAYTWFDGIQACKKTPTTIAGDITTHASTCPKCGTIKKSGTRSCCALGGAWFKQCGDVGNKKFAHTWLDGIQACQKTPTTIAGEITPRSSACPKCVAMKKPGKFSCCARGGAWFKNCGNPGDSKFDHTWVEGVQACKSLVAITSAMSGDVCPKCGTIKKNGKPSCCAQGGAWFKNCGDTGDSTFDHTWVEGVRSCKMKAAKGAHALGMSPHHTTIAKMGSATRLGTTGSGDGIGSRTNCKNHDEIAHIIVVTGFVFNVLHLIL